MWDRFTQNGADLVAGTQSEGVLLGAGAGAYSVTHILEPEGVFIPNDQRTPEEIAARADEIIGRDGPLTGLAGPQEQTECYIA